MKRLGGPPYPATAEMFDDFAARPDLVRGYIGPQGPAKFRYLVDPRITDGTSWITGANERGRPTRDQRRLRPGLHAGRHDRGGRGAGRRSLSELRYRGVEIRRGIEIAHIFALGRHYTDVFEVDTLGPDGAPVRITMGSYGIGITRAVATIAEQHLDERGLVWPASGSRRRTCTSSRPGTADRTGTRGSPPSSMRRACGSSSTTGPGLSAGVKFTDAELLGMPSAVVVGRRYAEGYVELRDRRSGTREDVPVDEVVNRLAGALGSVISTTTVRIRESAAKCRPRSRSCILTWTSISTPTSSARGATSANGGSRPRSPNSTAT